MTERDAASKVVVTDIHMPFWSMVIFMVKWAIAAIPAIVLLVVVGYGSVAVLASMGAAIANFRETVNTHSGQQPVPPQPVTYMQGPTESEKRCAATPNPGQCREAEQRCAGNSDHGKCMEAERRFFATS